MKRILNKLERDEKGQALLIVLILLVIGGLIIGPLLGYMSTGLIVGQAYEWRMDELYAADSGVEDALWQIMTKATGLPTELDPLMPPYSIDPVNDKVVNPIIIEYIDERTYRIESTATSPDTASSTTIESYVTILDFALFTDNAITSLNDVTIQPGTTVIGTVQYNGLLDDEPGDLIPDENEITDPIEGWPTAEQMEQWYWNDVKNAPSFPYGNPLWVNSLPATDPNIIGPQYYNGNLVFDNKNKVSSVYFDNATAPGTIYVNGNLTFNTPSKDYNIYLNGQTIFVTGNIVCNSAKVHLYGPGAIIAVGNITFQPQIEGTDFIFVMSIDGWVDFSPNGDFVGSVAGDVRVDIWPGYTFTWTEPVPTLNVPWQHSDRNIISEILTWEIILQ